MRTIATLSRIVAAFSVLASGIAAQATEPFFAGLGSYSREIATDSPKAQRYFT